jgi:hypothetical protein
LEIFNLDTEKIPETTHKEFKDYMRTSFMSVWQKNYGGIRSFFVSKEKAVLNEKGVPDEKSSARAEKIYESLAKVKEGRSNNPVKFIANLPETAASRILEEGLMFYSLDDIRDELRNVMDDILDDVMKVRKIYKNIM